MQKDDPLEIPADPAVARVRALGFMSIALVSTGLWLSLISSVYLALPRIRKILDDFGTEISPLTLMVLKYAGLVLPLIVIAAVIGLIVANKSRPMRTFALLVLPLILIAALVLSVGTVFFKLHRDLS